MYFFENLAFGMVMQGVIGQSRDGAIWCHIVLLGDRTFAVGSTSEGI
jgi:hypothetical protein